MITLAFDRMRTPRDRPESADAMKQTVVIAMMMSCTPEVTGTPNR